MNANRKNIGILPDDRPPLTDADGEVRELTDEDFKHFRPSKQVIPGVIEAFERMRGARGPQKSPVKERVGMRLDADIVRHFRDTGPGWQSRVNDVLRAHLSSQAKSMGKHT
jgi:uncharacterized protein (DUF4415 family)